MVLRRSAAAVIDDWRDHELLAERSRERADRRLDRDGLGTLLPPSRCGSLIATRSKLTMNPLRGASRRCRCNGGG